MHSVIPNNPIQLINVPLTNFKNLSSDLNAINLEKLDKHLSEHTKSLLKMS